MKKRMRKRGGFTLAEALIATAILALFVSMAIVGTSALFGTGEDMMAVSKAAVLGSDVMKVISNELRFGESFEDVNSGDSIKYNSTTYGEGSAMKLSDEKGREGELLIVSSSKSIFETSAKDKTGTESPLGTGEEGTTETSSDKKFYPIGSSSYDEVKIQSIKFTVKTVKNEKTKHSYQVIDCTLSITSDGTNTLWEKTVTIVPISQKTDP